MKGRSWGCGRAIGRGGAGWGGAGAAGTGLWSWAGEEGSRERRKRRTEEPGQALEALSRAVGDQLHITRLTLASMARTADPDGGAGRVADRADTPRPPRFGDSLGGLTAKIYYSRRTQGRICQGKGLVGRGSGRQGTSPGSCPSGVSTDCGDTWGVPSTGEGIRDPGPGVFLGAGWVGTSAWHVPRFQTPEGGRCPQGPRCLCRQLRPGTPYQLSEGPSPNPSSQT